MRFLHVLFSMAIVLLAWVMTVDALNISAHERDELTRDLTRWQKKFGDDDHVRAAMAMVRGTLTTDDLLRRLKVAKDKLPALQAANPYATFSHLTKFALLTDNEFSRLVSGSASAPVIPPSPASMPSNSRSNRSVVSGTIINSVDWTKQSICVPPVMTMGKCRSDWAIAAVASVSSAHCLATGEAIQLSVQQVLGCTYTGGLDRCLISGLTIDGMQWLLQQPSALCTRTAIPYTSGATGTVLFCSNNAHCAGPISLQVGAVEVIHGEAKIALQLQTQPVTGYVTVNNDPWRLYAGGILSSCSTVGSVDHHAVLVIGYGAEDFGYGTKPINYFKVRSNFGPNWGERGDIRLERGINTISGTCGIASHASYPALLLS
ncbi:hypothetical protein SPRG_06050 [Saprolegnia parasitica CBS 223.65]|uniref:Peptidase C1A papain C-terminal domain-containing protein n=1 Tax=Saprolegnia parasitica (strain CBS 223.65) TaxID=695850 RepID=A0A067CDV2_SAPPC|nr:hypothetical protein SPRG_06050 [Saprolegnia parasitica CBS 223.65]KDO28949.1 hypothetical protein SPRG_06050 [Saprolegnia parasitica CBS 223.65]|eukprot:XP_012200165.1 hypothetical protein SPRG_06050 [Saprolegnia parasitica CBS 223.65]